MIENNKLNTYFDVCDTRLKEHFETSNELNYQEIKTEGESFGTVNELFGKNGKIALIHAEVPNLLRVKMHGFVKLLRILNFGYDHISLFANIIEGKKIEVDMTNVLYISKLFQDFYPNETFGNVLEELEEILVHEDIAHNKYCIMRFMIMWIRKEIEIHNNTSEHSSPFNIEKHIRRFDEHTYLSECKNLTDLQLKNLIAEVVGFKVFGFSNENNGKIYEKEWLRLIFDKMDEYCCINPSFKYQDDFLCMENSIDKSIRILEGEEIHEMPPESNGIYDVFSYLNSNKTIVLEQHIESLCLYCLRDWCSFELKNPSSLKSISLSSCCNVSLKECTNLITVGLFGIDNFNPNEFTHLLELEKLYCNTINIKTPEMIGDAILESIRESQNLEILYILNSKFSKHITINFSIKSLSTLVLYYGNLETVEIQSDECRFEELEIIHLSLPNTNSSSANLIISGDYKMPELSFICCKNEEDYKHIINKI